MPMGGRFCRAGSAAAAAAGLVAMVALALALPPAGMAAEDEEESFGRLKTAPGAETTYYSCTACHSEMIIIQQGLDRGQWDEMLDWMTEEHGMSPPDPEERAIILDYLATHYSPDRPNYPAAPE